MKLRFFYNGIKAADGKLQRCWYSDAQLRSHPAGTITIYGRGRFSKDVAAEFIVENNTEMQTDYFEDDRIRVEPDHPLYAEVAAALAKQQEHRDRHVANVGRRLTRNAYARQRSTFGLEH
jgi:hypothetical protein